ncbi:DUF547 domain-containing protein [Pseudomarimonas salicorniae]|uniref:DUF547 domain-containing protein n=1 Tax=Pseudomarimonas salicorniae TaxID=2933270 RepID=A0ABT0GL10_9GAMM|nr:DUF547 domain-containing protein [Lysobacter sp. CAU 1642]MCK7595108.1 DUF547 domain-containing protein [Lysobacter sp. CAU 1642]
MRCAALLLLLAAPLLQAAPQAGFDHGHGAWSGLLERHVSWRPDGHASVVDYAGFESDRSALKAYLKALSAVPDETFQGFGRDEQLAFLINAYNAFTVELVLGGWPEIESIKDLGSLFRSPWRQRFFDLLGQRRHLDEIEHELIRGNPRLADPRIHFAVNCASIGCPALRPEAYVGTRLDAQLDDQTRRFLQDRSRNGIEDGALRVSPIFDWYEEDFGASDAPWDFLVRHAAWLADTPAEAARIRARQPRLRFGDYDWSLNTAPR